MRQSGIIAAACDYALDQNIARLAEDHANARTLAEGIAAIDGLAIDAATVETNLVYFDVTASVWDAERLCERLIEHGVRMGAMGTRRVRAVTHLDVSAEDISATLGVLRAILA
jgi:threonine aldolase